MRNNRGVAVSATAKRCDKEGISNIQGGAAEAVQGFLVVRAMEQKSQTRKSGMRTGSRNGTATAAIIRPTSTKTPRMTKPTPAKTKASSIATHNRTTAANSVPQTPRTVESGPVTSRPFIVTETVPAGRISASIRRTTIKPARIRASFLIIMFLPSGKALRLEENTPAALRAGFEQLPEAVELAGLHVVAVVLIGEAALLDFFGVFGEGIDGGLGEIGVAFCELGGGALCQAEDVVDDEYLAVAVRSGAAADDGDLGAFCDDFGDLGGGPLDEQGNGPRPDHLVGDVYELEGHFGGGRLGPEAAEFADGLGANADVGHNRHTSIANGPYDVKLGLGGLDLYQLSAGLGDEPPGVSDGLGHAQMVRQERHVGDKADVRGAAADGGGYRDHEIHRGLEGRVEAEHDLCGRVAHEYHLDVGLSGQVCGGVVVAAYCSEPAVVALGSQQIGSGYFPVHKCLLEMKEITVF